jgi:hypothetical protein
MKLTTPSKTRKVLAQGQIVTANSSTTIYTVPTGQVAEIRSFTLTNSSASATNVSVNIIPNGGSQAGSNFIVKSVSVPAQDVLPLTDVLTGAVLDGGWFIQVTASIGTAINYAITGEVG